MGAMKRLYAEPGEKASRDRTPTGRPRADRRAERRALAALEAPAQGLLFGAPGDADAADVASPAPPQSRPATGPPGPSGATRPGTSTPAPDPGPRPRVGVMRVERVHPDGTADVRLVGTVAAPPVVQTGLPGVAPAPAKAYAPPPFAPVADRVRRGAELLDRARPGWAAVVDTARLDPVSACECVLGQLYGRLGAGLAALFGRQHPAYGGDGSGLTTYDLADYGFASRPERDEYAEIGAAWRAEIRRRTPPPEPLTREAADA